MAEEDKEDNGPYNFRDIKIGDHLTTGRPIEWDGPVNEDTWDEVSAVKFHTTCPECGELIEFGDEYIQAQCDGCDIGEWVKADALEPFQDPGVFLDPTIEEDADIGELL